MTEPEIKRFNKKAYYVERVNPPVVIEIPRHTRMTDHGIENYAKANGQKMNDRAIFAFNGDRSCWR